MNNETFEKLLEQVQKPARYLGSEWNSVRKDLKNVDIKFALCFPDLYEIGMSHLGFKILYHLLNERDDLACERVFAPGLDLQSLLKAQDLRLFSLESKLPLSDFDIVGFSLAYEMTFTNVLNILDLGGIPLRSRERASSGPLIIAGGITVLNPEPMSDFFDLFVIGEAEEAILELIDEYKKFRSKLDRKQLLQKLSRIKGVYVPSLHNEPGAPEIEKRFVKNLDNAYYPRKQIIPYIKTVHDRISLEIMRGCPNKCRFCNAWVGYHYKRERSPDKVLNLAVQTQAQTGYEEISLLSLSSGDYSKIGKLIRSLIERFGGKDISVSLPSLRIDKALKEFPSVLNKAGIKSFTFAPEAGSERLRKLIGKDIDISALEETIDELRKSGWKRAKLYFMIGLPGETKEDLDAILNIIHGLKGELSVSVSSFIPKPHTPFQWEQMDRRDKLREKALYLKRNTKSRRVKLDFHDPNLSFLEGVLSRGDRKVGELIYRAFKKGAIFDSWGEHFKFELWLEALEESGIDPHFYLYRTRSYEERLPWDHIDTGISKKYLIEESQKARGLI